MRARLLVLVCALAGAILIAACGSSAGTAGAGLASGSATSASSAASGSAASASSAANGSASSASSAASASATSSAAAAGPSLSYEGVPLETGPLLAPASSTRTGTVDGVSCGAIEQLAYHIHAHLAVFDDGTEYALPGGVGIPGSQTVNTTEGPVAVAGRCFYWLHTHTNDGVIHIESPTRRVYTLGQFFDEWHQPLSPDQVASRHGAITAFVDGRIWKRDPRDIPLLPHEDIQLEIGDPIPPLVTVDWSATQL